MGTVRGGAPAEAPERTPGSPRGWPGPGGAPGAGWQFSLGFVSIPTCCGSLTETSAAAPARAPRVTRDVGRFCSTEASSQGGADTRSRERVTLSVPLFPPKSQSRGAPLSGRPQPAAFVPAPLCCCEGPGCLLCGLARHPVPRSGPRTVVGAAAQAPRPHRRAPPRPWRQQEPALPCPPAVPQSMHPRQRPVVPKRVCVEAEPPMCSVGGGLGRQVVLRCVRRFYQRRPSPCPPLAVTVSPWGPRGLPTPRCRPSRLRS